MKRILTKNHDVLGQNGRFVLSGNRLAVDFANTLYAPAEPAGAVRSWEDLIDFLDAAGGLGRSELERLQSPGRTEPERCARLLSRALALRTVVRLALRAIAMGRPVKPAWVEAVNRVLRSEAGPDQLVPTDSGWLLEPAPKRRGPLTALVPIARSMAELIAEGRGVPIRRCANPTCVLYFYDDSRTRRRRWCSMAVCGNRMKVAAHARRRRGLSG